ncbi:hypothetical protein LVB87_08025 [Lysobacter sp. KIS68-7]|uniref:XAC0095 family protein n=1 Tax=Lysobacter sp. KIS68-7 TaxID=2904252 RepID=UPI001E5C84FB|nr:hypothetical protein [Lysobacter sp. KIS68-7]UHQ18179.1 hypothetical protein LVB87_08025 [Lysobacter sp. KIS68-7]
MRQSPPQTAFVLPDAAQRSLFQLRDRLRVLVQLSASASPESRREALLTPALLAWWFNHFSREIDDVVDAAYWTANSDR